MQFHGNCNGDSKPVVALDFFAVRHFDGVSRVLKSIKSWSINLAKIKAIKKY